MKIFLLFMSVFTVGVLGDTHLEEWSVKYEQGTVKISSRKTASKYEEIKAESDINFSMTEVSSIFGDVKAMKEWMGLLDMQQIDDNHVYMVCDFPWPLSDRDIVGYTEEIYNADSTHITYLMTAVPDYIPAKQGLVRIQEMKGDWMINKIDDSTTHVMNQFYMDLGGLPNWAVKKILVEAPIYTFQVMDSYLKGNVSPHMSN